MRILSRFLFVISTSLSLFSYAGSPKIESVILVKDTVDTYETGKNELSRPYRISQLGRDIVKYFSEDENYKYLDNESINHSFIQDSWDEDITISSIGDNYEGFKIQVNEISEDSCKAHVEHAEDMKFFTTVNIYDKKGNRLDGCKKNSFWIFGKNNTIPVIIEGA